MNTFRTLLVLSLMTVFSGMAYGQSVTSTFDEDYSLSKLKTWQFKTEKRDDADPLATDTVMEKKMQDALDDELHSYGYNPPYNDAPPDFLVSIHVKLRDKTDERGRDYDYVQGVLIVDFYDAETKRLIWRGIVTGSVGTTAVDLKLAEEQVKKAAKLLLERFSNDRLGL